MWKKFFTERLAGFATANELADWLSRMLCLLYDAPCLKEVQEFRLLNSEMECPSLTMNFLYRECMPEGRQLMFRQAISKLLLRHEKDANVPAETFEDLIYLAGLIKRVDLLESLTEAIINRLARKGERKSLYSALEILDSFAPAEEARKAVSSLIDSDGFDEVYFFSALKILIECEPSEAMTLVARFGPRIIKRYQRFLKKGKKGVIEFWDKVNDIFCGRQFEGTKDCILRCLLSAK